MAKQGHAGPASESATPYALSDFPAGLRQEFTATKLLELSAGNGHFYAEWVTRYASFYLAKWFMGSQR